MYHTNTAHWDDEQMNEMRFQREVDERNRPWTDEELDAVFPSDGCLSHTHTHSEGERDGDREIEIERGRERERERVWERDRQRQSQRE